MSPARKRPVQYLVRMGTCAERTTSAARGFAHIRQYLDAYDKDLTKRRYPCWLRFTSAPRSDGIGKQWTYTNDRGMVLATIRRIA